MKTVRIAVLTTCHNRKDKTLNCLGALFSQVNINNVRLEVYLVDDSCTDGTGEAVREQYQQVNVLQSHGNLYWCGGMRVAFAEAMKGDYDYYLWLNDDTYLYPQAIQILLETARKVREINGRDGIVVGAMCDPDTGEPTYGGLISKNRWKGFEFMRVAPSDKPKRCDTMNGNFVLIPREVMITVGNLMQRQRSAYVPTAGEDASANRITFSMGVDGVYVAPCGDPVAYILVANAGARVLSTIVALTSKWTTEIRRKSGSCW